jgi:citrate lyase subunit beta/citryl-CoA lyase
MPTPLPLPRTYLFVPGDRPERFDKARASGADAIVLDLEDAVSPARKAAAREAIAAALRAGGRWVVRINDAASPWFADDLALLAAAPADSVEVMLPKAESPAPVAAVRAVRPRAPVLALIESARGVTQVEAVAAAPGVSRLVFGTLDFALDLDLDITDDPAGLACAASRIAIASRAAGLASPIAGVTPEIHDDTRLLADLAWARRLGFGAKLCIHPRQIAPLHQALEPDAQALDWARRVVAAVAASPDLHGAVQVDGRMVDKPVLRRAEALLARARRHA